MQNAILYQAYGGNDFINECRYSLLKYLAVYNLNPPSSTGIVIYTDAPPAFADFLPFFHQLHCIPVSAATVKRWQGPQAFVHRFKIEMMADFFTRFDGNLLYCDTDTYATSALDKIFSDLKAGDSYMHEGEGVINAKRFPQFYKWEKFLSATPLVYNGKALQFHPGLTMFNAGVVGLSSEKKELLSDVLALTDSVYEKFPKHIAEQFAFSYCLQQAGTVNEAKGAIAHYWDLKEFRSLLRLFFERNGEEGIPALVKKVQRLDALRMMKEKQAFERRPLLSRVVKKLFGKGWRMSDYEKRV